MPQSISAISSKLLIFGNSGSGKSMMAKRIGSRTSQCVFDLDLIHWHEDGRERDEDASRAKVREIVMGPSWIVEGVYGWLAEIAVHRATAVIWTDLPWSECQDGLISRGLRPGTNEEDQQALLSWAEAYWSRSTPSSAIGHERLFASFAGEKVRLSTRREINDFLWRFEAAIST
jgi:adenylate kinase family enzyme